MPAIPDRHASRGRARVDAGVLDVVELALKGDVRLGPQRLHDPHLLGRTPPAVVEILVEADELDLVPADPDAEPEPPAAQHIERGRLLGNQHRLALRQDQDADGKADLLRAASQKPEQHERVVIGGGGGADPPALVIRRGVGAEHMVGCDRWAKPSPSAACA